jgi:hypothetical protein
MVLGLKSSLLPPSTHNIAPGPIFGVHLRMRRVQESEYEETDSNYYSPFHGRWKFSWGTTLAWGVKGACQPACMLTLFAVQHLARI